MPHVFIWATMLINFGVALWCLVVITLNWTHWDAYAKRWKFALLFYTFSVCFLTAEVIVKDLIINGYRYALLTASSLFLVYTLVANHRHYDQ